MGKGELNFLAIRGGDLPHTVHVVGIRVWIVRALDGPIVLFYCDALTTGYIRRAEPYICQTYLTNTFICFQ